MSSRTEAAAMEIQGYTAALAGLPAMGPGRLKAVLAEWAPAEAWRRVRQGSAVRSPTVAAACRPDPAGVAACWRRVAEATDVEAVWRAHVDRGVAVHVWGSDGYLPELADDHQAPAVLFSRGDLAALHGRRAAVVGTRRCTRYGRDVARELGRELARNGVRVVSGLALGVDGAAHAGALEAGGAPPIAVVGSGLDVIYPRRHADLWARVAEAGLLLSEAPLGALPEPWRFPVRNRIIAALAEVVVVVESHATGGSRHTVDAAEARARTVMAVPGPVRSSASSFTNTLLAEGCPPARDVTDVLVALNLSTSAAPSPAPGRRPDSDPLGAEVLEAMGWEPATLDQVVAGSRRSPAEVSVALARLEQDGWVTARQGWWERTDDRQACQ